MEEVRVPNIHSHVATGWKTRKLYIVFQSGPCPSPGFYVNLPGWMYLNRETGTKDLWEDRKKDQIPLVGPAVFEGRSTFRRLARVV